MTHELILATRRTRLTPRLRPAADPEGSLTTW